MAMKAFDWCRNLQPDIVLLDKRMPIIDGISVLKHLKKIGLTMPIVMLTTSSNEQDLLDALKAGASGYLLKDMEPDELVLALRDIHVGKTVVAPPLTSVLVRFVKGDMTVSQAQGPFSELTPREGEILELMAEGQGNKLIARKPRHIRRHRQAARQSGAAQIECAFTCRSGGHVHRAQSSGCGSDRRVTVSPHARVSENSGSSNLRSGI